MRYMVIKYVDADNQAEALKKSRKTPVHEITIHNDPWKESGYQLKINNKKIGFKDAKKRL